MILMLTAAGGPADRVKGLALGADDYLPKPFHFPELVLRVRALARRKPTARQPTLQAGGIELDPRTGTVTRDGRTIELSTKSVPYSKPYFCQPWRTQRRAAARAGLGRERRSIHQRRQGHDRPAETQTRSAPDHPQHPRRRLPDHRSALTGPGPRGRCFFPACSPCGAPGPGGSSISPRAACLPHRSQRRSGPMLPPQPAWRVSRGGPPGVG